MSTRFVVVSFLGLGLGFYELSGGADFAPPERAERTVATAAETSPQPAPPTSERAAQHPLAKPDALARAELPEARPLADPRLRDQVALRQLAQAGQAINSTAAAFDGRSATSQLQLVSLEGGLAGITSQVITPTEPVAVQIEAPAQDIRYVRASRVNMRQGPGTNYSVLTRLLADDKVRVLEDSGTGWLRLKVDSTGRIGWIAASLLTKKAP